MVRDKDVLERALDAARMRLGPVSTVSRLGQVVQPILDHLSGSEAIGTIIEQYLAQVVPAHLNGRWRVSALSGGCLHIQAHDPACAYELRLLSDELLDGLRSHGGLKRLRRIKIRPFRQI